MDKPTLTYPGPLSEFDDSPEAPSFSEGFHLSLLELTTHACSTSTTCTTNMTIDMENKHD